MSSSIPVEHFLAASLGLSVTYGDEVLDPSRVVLAYPPLEHPLVDRVADALADRYGQIPLSVDESPDGDFFRELARAALRPIQAVVYRVDDGALPRSWSQDVDERDRYRKALKWIRDFDEDFGSPPADDEMRRIATEALDAPATG